MNIKCSELDNIIVSFDYFNLIKAVGDELVKYIRGFNPSISKLYEKTAIISNKFC